MVPSYNVFEQVVLLIPIVEGMGLMATVRSYMKGNPIARSKAQINLVICWFFVISPLLYIEVLRARIWDTPNSFVNVNLASVSLAIVMTLITVRILNSKRIQKFSRHVVVPEFVEFCVVLGVNVLAALVAASVIGYDWGPSLPIVWGICFIVAWHEKENTEGYSLYVFHVIHDILLYVACVAAIFISPLALGGMVLLLMIDTKVVSHKILEGAVAHFSEEGEKKSKTEK